MAESMAKQRWHDHKAEQRAAKRRDPRGWKAGHRLRSQRAAFPGRGDKFVTVGNGAFGVLATFDPQLYREYAAGTQGASG